MMFFRVRKRVLRGINKIKFCFSDGEGSKYLKLFSLSSVLSFKICIGRHFHSMYPNFDYAQFFLSFTERCFILIFLDSVNKMCLLHLAPPSSW